MFTQIKTSRKFDRNIFDGTGEEAVIHAENPTELLYYYKGDQIVGMIEGHMPVLIYRGYRRFNYLPVQIYVNGVDHCGWVDTNKIELSL